MKRRLKLVYDHEDKMKGQRKEKIIKLRCIQKKITSVNMKSILLIIVCLGSFTLAQEHQNVHEDIDDIQVEHD